MWKSLFLVGLTLPFMSPSGGVCVEDDKESTRVCLPTISVKDMLPMIQFESMHSKSTTMSTSIVLLSRAVYRCDQGL